MLEVLGGKMILIYEDEPYFIDEYIDILKEKGYIVETCDNAIDLLIKLKENYRVINLIIIDIMVFGPGNEFDGRETDGGARSGLVLLDEIEKLEAQFPDSNPRKKIIFTNRKGPVFEQAQRDKRVLKAIKKADVLPSEFLIIINEALNEV